MAGLDDRAKKNDAPNQGARLKGDPEDGTNDTADSGAGHCPLPDRSGDRHRRRWVRRFAMDGAVARSDELAPLCGPEIAPGKPDGATVDADGRYWNARFGGDAVACISAEGRLERLTDLPAAGPTCVALGSGSEADLYVTALRTRQTEEQSQAILHAGGLFRVRTSTTGLPQRIVAL